MSIRDLLSNRDVLNKLDLLRHAEPSGIAHLIERCKERNTVPGEVILDPAVENNQIYIVLEGELEVRAGEPDGECLSTLGAGACAGEMSMLDPEATPTAYVISKSAARLLMLDHETMWALVNRSHAVARNLLVVLLTRMRSDKKRIADSAVILRQFERRALSDPLTDVNNRNGMEDLFPRELNRCRAAGRPACVIMADIDYFRRFNNEKGHIAGDHALTVVAHGLRRYLRPTDLIARYGGDEFAALLPDTMLSNAVRAAERVRESVTVMAREQGFELPLTLSMGVAQLLGQDTLATLINRADEALLRAKRTGRNRVSQ